MADDTPNLPAVDDAIEGTVVQPWHVTADYIEPGRTIREIADEMCLSRVIEAALAAWPPPEPDHHEDPSIRLRMLADHQISLRIRDPRDLLKITGV